MAAAAWSRVVVILGSRGGSATTKSTRKHHVTILYLVILEESAMALVVAIVKLFPHAEYVGHPCVSSCDFCKCDRNPPITNVYDMSYSSHSVDDYQKKSIRLSKKSR